MRTTELEEEESRGKFGPWKWHGYVLHLLSDRAGCAQLHVGV